MYELLHEYLKSSFPATSGNLFYSKVQATSEDSFSSISNKRFLIIVGLICEYKGRILVELEEPTANILLEKMNFDEPLESIEEKTLFLGELGNMIGGKIITALNNAYGGLELRLTPPIVFSGDDLEVISPTVDSITTYFSTDYGIIKIDIGIEGCKPCLNLEDF